MQCNANETPKAAVVCVPWDDRFRPSESDGKREREGGGGSSIDGMMRLLDSSGWHVRPKSFRGGQTYLVDGRYALGRLLYRVMSSQEDAGRR